MTEIERVCAVVCPYFGLDPSDVLKPGRAKSSYHSNVRWIIFYILHAHFGWTIYKLSKHTGVSQAGAHKGIMSIDGLRFSDNFDNLMFFLTQEVASFDQEAPSNAG